MGECGAAWGNRFAEWGRALARGHNGVHMFLGQYRLVIDDKGRLTLPSRFRNELARGVVVTRGLDGCLRIYPADQWQDIARQVRRLPSNHKDNRDYLRYMFAGAIDLSPDKQGRILLPANLRQYAKLDSDVIVIGLDEYMEVWNAEAWDKVELRVEEHAEEIAERIGVPLSE